MREKRGYLLQRNFQVHLYHIKHTFCIWVNVLLDPTLHVINNKRGLSYFFR